MKKFLAHLVVVISFALFASCEDDISPLGDLPDKYAVNLILRGDTTLQTAYISRLYAAENFDPYSNEIDPAVEGAKVSLKYAGSETEYFFSDTVDNGKINSRYGTPAKYYYLKNFTPQFGKELELKVVLPDGQTMTSKTKVPQSILFDLDNTTPFIPGPLIGRDTVNVTVAWKSSSLEFLKASKVKIVYFHKELSGEKIRHEKEVQLSISVDGADIVENYIDITFNSYLKINRKLLEEALEEISEGDGAKGRYSVAPLEIDVFFFDDNLTRFYSAGLFFDFGFTVRNYPGDLSNINNGLGFFASYVHANKIIKFETQYLLNRFGYLTEK